MPIHNENFSYKKCIIIALLSIPLLLYGAGIVFTIYMDYLYKNTHKFDPASSIEFPIVIYKEIFTCSDDSKIIYYGAKDACTESGSFPWADDPTSHGSYNEYYKRRVVYSSPVIERSWQFFITNEETVVYKFSNPQKLKDWK